MTFAGSAGPLSGITIALAESRELDRLASILEGDAATILRCPLVSILDAPDSGPIDAWVRTACQNGFDDLILLTGEGLRRLIGRAEAVGCRDQFLLALRKMRKITRGPKPARELHAVGLATDMAANPPTSQGIMELLGPHDLNGRRVGLQLYGTEPNLPLVRFLEGAGAQVFAVAPYVYAPGSDDDAVSNLISRMRDGAIGVIVFTSASQVDRIFALAHERGIEPVLREGLARTQVAAIGPIAAEALEDRNRRPDILPEEPFVMKRLTGAIAAAVGKK